MNNVAAVNTNVVFSPTNLFDVDPIVGSTFVPGFNALLNASTGVYRKYRVRSARIHCSFANLEGFPANVYLCPTNSNLGANLSNPYLITANPLCVQGPISIAQGSSTRILTSAVSTASFGGSNGQMVDDDYSAFYNTSPTNNWFFIMGAETDGTATFLSGVDLWVEIDILCDFYELNNVAT